MEPDELKKEEPQATPQEPVSSEPAPVSAEPKPDDKDQRVDAAPDPGAMKSEIEKLAEVREKARRDAEYWRRQKVEARADYFKSRQEPRDSSPAQLADEPKPPRQEDFDDYNKFTAAQNKYFNDLVDYRTNQKMQTWQREQAQKQAEESHQQRMASLQEKLNQGFQKYEDFEEIALSDTVPINQVVAEVLAECENPEDVAYYLGRNRAEAMRLSRMTPAAVGREIGRIEMQLKQSNTPQPNKLKTVTNAPPPIKPLGSQNTVQRDLEKMSQREFEAEMERRTGRRY